jgi:hypothetical protein
MPHHSILEIDEEPHQQKERFYDDLILKAFDYVDDDQVD